MSVENWIDAVVAVAGSVASHTGGKVKAYRVATRGEIPEALSVFPCAIVYPTRTIGLQFSQGGPCKEIWEVRGEFYLFADIKKTNLPDLVRYFAKIRNATLLKQTLGGLVDDFSFGDEGMTLVSIAYETDGPERHGIVAMWRVKADVGSEITFGA